MRMGDWALGWLLEHLHSPDRTLKMSVSWMCGFLTYSGLQVSLSEAVVRMVVLIDDTRCFSAQWRTAPLGQSRGRTQSCWGGTL
jgi:hypothetical protein